MHGNLRFGTDGNGNTTEYTYSVLHQLLTVAQGGKTTTKTYDANGNQLTETDWLGNTSENVYDALNRLIERRDATGITIQTLLREYDRTGRLARVTDTAGATTHTVIYTYNENGSVASVLYPDSVREDYTYTIGNLLETLTNTLSDGTVLETYTYTYDLARNLIEKQDAKGTTAYTYDPLGRLITVTEPSGKLTEYTYDGSGNRSTQTVTETGEDETVTVVCTTYTYDARNRLLSLSKEDISDALIDPILLEVTDYTYDHSGNQLLTTRTTYTDGVAGTPVLVQSNTYDVWNQLIRTETENGTVVENAYNGDGRRVIKTVNGAATYYLYEYEKVILETNVYGDVTGRNVYGLNLLIRTVGVDTFYYMYNGHADVTALLTPEGAVAASYYYDAFGNILEQTGDVNNSILFAGYQYDKETGLYYLNARMYDPVTARFMQEDTVAGQREDPLSLNLYTYCHNSPLMYWDPTGHSAEDVYRTEKSYDYHGYSLTGDGFGDNLAEREMRKAMHSEYPGKPASSAADLARINAGAAGDEFKAPTVVYKSVKIAVEVKEDTNNSRTIQDYEWQKRTEETILENKQEELKNYIAPLSGRDEREFFNLIVFGREPYRGIVYDYVMLEEVAPIFTTTDIEFSYLGEEGIVYDVGVDYPFPYHLLMHEISHAIDSASGWESHSMGDIIVQDIQDNISNTVERMLNNQLRSEGFDDNEIEKRIDSEVNIIVDYILNPMNSSDNRDEYPRTMTITQERTLDNVKTYYRNQFAKCFPENAIAGDLYSGLTNGYLESNSGHDNKTWYGVDWQSDPNIIKNAFSQEFFAHAFPILLFGEEKYTKALSKWFPCSSQEIEQIITETDYSLK